MKAGEWNMNQALILLRYASELAASANEQDLPSISLRLEIVQNNLYAARHANTARELATSGELRRSADRIFEQAMTAMRVWSDIPARLTEDRYKHV